MRFPWCRYQWFNGDTPGGWRFTVQTARRHGLQMHRGDGPFTVRDRRGMAVWSI